GDHDHSVIGNLDIVDREKPSTGTAQVEGSRQSHVGAGGGVHGPDLVATTAADHIQALHAADHAVGEAAFGSVTEPGGFGVGRIGAGVTFPNDALGVKRGGNR